MNTKKVVAAFRLNWATHRQRLIWLFYLPLGFAVTKICLLQYLKFRPTEQAAPRFNLLGNPSYKKPTGTSASAWPLPQRMHRPRAALYSHMGWSAGSGSPISNITSHYACRLGVPPPCCVASALEIPLGNILSFIVPLCRSFLLLWPWPS